MKDKISIKKSTSGKNFTITRTLSEKVSPADLDKRILAVDKDIETYEDGLENLLNNKEKLMEEYSEKIDSEAKKYRIELDNLLLNRKALQDAKEKGEGVSESIIQGNTADGAVSE